jgi:hypothetical protein
MPRLLAVLAVAFLVTSTAAAARQPTPRETIQLHQAVFDYYFTNPLLSKITIERTHVVALRPSPVQSRLVTKYATISVRAHDASGQDVGGNLAIAVYFASPTTGWHVFDSGSSDVGCSMVKWYPSGEERAILKSLGLACPSP